MAAQLRNNMTSGSYRRVYRKNYIIKKHTESAEYFGLTK
jgi:hypothetical protein